MSSVYRVYFYWPEPQTMCGSHEQRLLLYKSEWRFWIASIWENKVRTIHNPPPKTRPMPRGRQAIPGKNWFIREKHKTRTAYSFANCRRFDVKSVPSIHAKNPNRNPKGRETNPMVQRSQHRITTCVLWARNETSLHTSIRKYLICYGCVQDSASMHFFLF